MTDQRSSDFAELMAQALAGAKRPLAEAETLPPQAYCSQAFFDAEAERVFRRDWIAVAHSSQLPNVGDYLSIDLLGEMLMIVRGADRIRVLSRICLHRWAPLVEGSGNRRGFVCPFHAWTYALDGHLVGAPLMREAAGFNAKDCKLPEYACEVVDGFVYMSFANEPAPLAPALADMLEHQGNFRAGELVLDGTLSYDLKINWKIIVETFMECYHHLAAHPVTFERDFPARLSWGEETRAAWTIVHSPARENAGDDVFFSGLPELPGLTAAEKSEFRLYLVYPFQLISTFGDRMVWFALQPDGPDRTRMQTHLLVRPETAALESFAAERDKQMQNWDEINMEDIRVNEMQQRGAATAAARPGRLSQHEIAVWQLAEYLRARLAA